MRMLTSSRLGGLALGAVAVLAVTACEPPQLSPAGPSAATGPVGVDLTPVQQTVTPTVSPVLETGGRGSEQRTLALVAVSEGTKQVRLTPVP